MVLISGFCDQKDFGRGDFQELDQIADVAPFSKLSIIATDITKIPSSVLQVLDQCGSGRPGGCYLDLPSDVLCQTITKEEAEKFWLLIGEIFSSKDEGNEEGKETKSKGDQAKDLLAKYGGAYLATSITLSLISFALCYALINAGVDVAALLQKIGITSNETGEKVGTFALAYAAHKAASPIRFPPTVALTPIVANWIGKKVDKEQ